MARFGKPVRGFIARLKGAIFVLRKARFTKPRFVARPHTFHRSFNILAIAAISMNILATGIPALVASYNDAQARHPQALISAIGPATTQETRPAADAAPIKGGKATKLPDTVKQQLADDLKKQQDGKPSDHRKVQALDEGRTATDRVYLNADGTKSLVRSFQATSFKDTAGNWQDVDTTLVQDKASGNWQAKANSWSPVFGDISTDGIQVAQGGQVFKFSPVGAKSVKPTVSGNAPNQIRFRL